MDSSGRPIGVKLDYFRTFIRQNDIQSSWTTSEVCDRIVMSKTKAADTNIRYAELIPEVYRGPAEVFISHAWSRPFSRIIDSLLRKRIYSRCNAKTFVWFDLFAIHQNEGQKQNEDFNAIPEVIEKCDRTVLLLDQSSDHDIPVMLTRIWCLYEMYITLKCEKGFVLVFDDPLLFSSPYPLTKIESAYVTKPEDKRRILNIIGNNVDDVNEVLNKVLHNVWFVRAMVTIVSQWVLIWIYMLDWILKLALTFNLLGLSNIVRLITITLFTVTFPYWAFVNTIFFLLTVRRYHVRVYVMWVILITNSVGFNIWRNADNLDNVVILFTDPKMWGMYCFLLISVLRWFFGACWSILATEYGIVSGYILWRLITSITVFSTWDTEHAEVKYLWDHFPAEEFENTWAVLFTVSIGIVITLITLMLWWLLYFRYRNLRTTVRTTSNIGFCWSWVWTCLTFGIELRFNPKFVKGYNNQAAAVSLMEPLLGREEDL